ncbi:putative fungistatic metabolite-like protein [Hapsidospora chrysogenum ATCC 11550]|uniref:Putative fungistatic metabolite-like protein n=1 Tax=Hapsidospora chrysogenum (strain ATCC 11550 / CBS 779.69 / DSM 880 / IAM 14645 / JCM 23072 / IMI 49137) TaxID=857340 RepID=A0A086TF86_HAPC1|nr:putative fungistatic metabolite-like protein [Hapsidospora chrysogenum ATCC 11550]
MKVAAYGAALAALAGTASAAKETGTFAVLRFTNKQLTKGRIDPIASPGKPSSHVHTVMGGSGFSMNATGEDLMNSKCSNTMVKGDFSNYWFPSLYFMDPVDKKLEDVPVHYVNVYYFFEESDDDIKPFPVGLRMLAGDPWTRTPPSSAETNLDPSKGDIVNVKWTCPRQNPNGPAWPEDSDGSMAGIGDPVAKDQGVGFPHVDCDGFASPLRADIHMPSCYKPEAGLENYKENMAWPTMNENGKLNCKEGEIHVPHLFYEVYWDTPKFSDRWTPGQGKQPFVLSTGDATGYSSHADFMAGWDEELLQHIIDTCNAGTLGMDTCPGLFYGLNDDDCTIESEVDEKVDGILDALPGNCPILGWDYGLDGLEHLIPDEGVFDPAPTSKPSDQPAPSSSVAADPEEPTAAPKLKPELGAVFAQSQKSKPAAPKSTEKPKPAPKPTEAPKPASKPEPTKKMETVWETATVTAYVYAETSSGVSAAVNDNRKGSTVFEYAGCYKDTEERALSGLVNPDIGEVSNEKCILYCMKAGFSLAGTEYGGECYCGNELAVSEKLDEGACALPCDGDEAATCGGDWALSVYSAKGEAKIKSRKSRRHLHAHHLHGHRRSYL